MDKILDDNFNNICKIKDNFQLADSKIKNNACCIIDYSDKNLDSARQKMGKIFASSYVSKSCTPSLISAPKGGKLTEKQKINKLFDETAKKYKIPPDILKAIAWLESNWNNNAESVDDRVGIMQIDQKEHAFAKTKDAKDPALNIDYCAKYLKNLYDNITSSNPTIDKKTAWNKALKLYGKNNNYDYKVSSLSKTKPWIKYVQQSSQAIISTGKGVYLDVTPLPQSNNVSCGQTSVAVATNFITGKNINDKYIDKNYGFELHDALNKETQMDWDCKFASDENWPYWQGTWGHIEESLRCGYPVIMGFNRPFSVTGKGHIITICGIEGDKVYYADSNGGIIKETTKQVMEAAQPHPDGKFYFIPKKVQKYQ